MDRVAVRLVEIERARAWSAASLDGAAERVASDEAGLADVALVLGICKRCRRRHLSSLPRRACTGTCTCTHVKVSAQTSARRVERVRQRHIRGRLGGGGGKKKDRDKRAQKKMIKN